MPWITTCVMTNRPTCVDIQWNLWMRKPKIEVGSTASGTVFTKRILCALQWLYMCVSNYRQLDFCKTACQKSKPYITGLMWKESTKYRWIPSQRGSNTENASMLWRHRANRISDLDVTTIIRCRFTTVSLQRCQMTVMESPITGQSNVCSTLCLNWQQRNIKGPRNCLFVRGIHWWPVDSTPKGTGTRKMFSFDDVIVF